jgi:hypothetical protein
MKSITIKINDKDVVVKKLPLGKYAEVISALDKLPQTLGSIDKVSTEKVLSLLPKMISESFPELVRILSIASDVPEKELTDEYGLDDITVLLKAIFEVNNFELVKKNVQGLFQKKEEVPMSTGLKK